MTPQNDHEWTVHAINIHGVFFERWCQEIVREIGGWHLAAANLPVSWPPPNGPLIGKESNLDIRAELRNNRGMLTLLIECKKNNPDFIDWIFFLKQPVRQAWEQNARVLLNKPLSSGAQSWAAQAVIGGPVQQHPLADEARETKGIYSNPPKQNQTRTSNTAVTEASYQVALATQAIFAQEANLNSVLSQSPQLNHMPYERNLILPAIVTTARLFTCDFDPAAIDPHRGEIPYDKVTLTERPFLFYDYPLPAHLQAQPTNSDEANRRGMIERFIRLPILVIQSASFASVLQSHLPLMLEHLLVM